MTMTAEDDIRRIMRLQEVEYDRSVGQYHRVPAWNSMGNAIHIRAVGRRIIKADNA